MASPVESALRRAVADLDALKVRWALALKTLAGRNQDPH